MTLDEVANRDEKTIPSVPDAGRGARPRAGCVLRQANQGDIQTIGIGWRFACPLERSEKIGSMRQARVREVVFAVPIRTWCSTRGAAN